MANLNQEPTFDRREPVKEGSSLSGSKLRNDVSTDKALHPENSNDREEEIVDQDPGERQKENQNQQKDDPLAA